MPLYSFYVSDISCINCAKKIKQGLESNKNNPIESAYVDVTNKQVIIEVLPHTKEIGQIKEELRTVISELGFNCQDLIRRSEVPADAVSPNEIKKKKNPFQLLFVFLSSHWFLGAIGILSGATLLILSLILTGGLPLPALIAIAAVSSVFTLILGAPFYYSALKKLYKTRALTMDLLFSISTLTVIVVSIAALFQPWLPMMFEAGLLIFGFRHLGIAIEDSLKLNIAGRSFQDRIPKKVQVIANEYSIEERATHLIKPGDILLLHAGDIIPVDGDSLTTGSYVYDDIDTGAVIARPIKQNEHLTAGMRLAESVRSIKFVAKSTTADSYLAEQDKEMIKAISRQSPIEDVSQQILQYFIPTVLALALLSGIVMAIFFPPSLAIQCAVAVLVSACPCILGTIPSLAMKIGIKKGIDNNVQFRSAEALQAAGGIDAVVFDMNGTLTMGIPTGTAHGVFSEQMSKNDLLCFFAAMEEKYAQQLEMENQKPHPVAKAICNYATKKIKQSQTPLQVEQLNYSHHSGLTAQINQKKFVLGNQTMLEDCGIQVVAFQKKIQSQLKSGESIIYLACENQVVGYMLIEDPLRKDALQTINALKDMGKEIFICTGADKATANRHAKLLGLSSKNVYANCVARKTYNKQSKTDIITNLKNNGYKVAMVGDGGNDILAFTNSNFSIAMRSRSGDEMAQLKAGAVVKNGKLLPIASAFAIANQTITNIKQNVTFSLIYNISAVILTGGLLAALGFTIHPAVGVALMILQATLILANAYRFKNQPLEHLGTDKIGDLAIKSSYQYFGKRMQLQKEGLAMQNNFVSHPENPLFGEKKQKKTMESAVQQVTYSYTN